MNIPYSPGSTHVGSVPHVESGALCEYLASTLDIPAWPQLPRRSFRESMYVQYSGSLPGVVIDEAKEKITFNTEQDLSPALESFYERYLTEDVDAFALPPAYAAGFYTMLDVLKSTSGEWVKGQVIGPVSFGLTVTDQSLRSSLYHDALSDVIIKNSAMCARWQARTLRAVRPHVIIFADEPYMASFGSAFISLSREQAIAMLDEVFDALHQEDALAGVHCCGNTDWSVLLATHVDILNLDAYSHLDNLALYPAELNAFLQRGGVIAWGIVPNNEEIKQTTPAQLAQRLRTGIDGIVQKAEARGVALAPETLLANSLITPNCGLGSTTVDIAEAVLRAVKETAELLH
ncbi:MAG: methionine synthase [Anaerolineae bacterium]|nr:methionine synthase [Anaerolineae bacterium]